MTALSITVFPDLSGSVANEYATDVDGLVQWLEALPEYPNKAACPLISLARYGETRSDKNSLRINANIIAATGVIGDYDAGEMTPQEAISIFSALGIQAVIVTTPSHGMKGQRWRLLLPFESERSIEEKHSLICKANGLLGGILAGESFTASQAFYVGRVDGVEYAVYRSDGQNIDAWPHIGTLPEVGKALARMASPGSVDEFSLIPKRAEGGVGQIRAVLERIPNTELDWQHWNRVGMAVYNASSGSDEGLEAWREWSDQCGGEDDSVDDRWAHYAGSPPTELGMGTLVYLAGGLPPAPPTPDPLADQFGAPKLRGTEGQVQWASLIRAQKLVDCAGDEALIESLCKRSGPSLKAAFWIDNRELTPEQLAERLAPVQSASNANLYRVEPVRLSGFQFLGVDQQIELFAGCVYIQRTHQILTPSGDLLQQAQFNSVYGGYTFQLECDASGKTTRRAWEAFTESQAVRFPKVEGSCFNPSLDPGALVKKDGRMLINVYTPVETRRCDGDPSPFLNHLKLVLPDVRDREILLAYMAACIQYKGVKFQWAPLLQGTPGNGKTLFTRCVAFAISDRYTHYPLANELSEKYNDWLFGRLFIGIEDIYVPEHKREVIEILKPMITNDRMAMRAMQQGQVMDDNLANFMLNSNYRDGIRKTRNDRRFAVFFTAQQTKEDLIRDGMRDGYFPRLYNWLKGEGDYAKYGEGYGYAVVAQYLEEYQIPEELNPATLCHDAPDTSSTAEAIDAGRGTVEQEVLEAIEQGRPGFAGGWVSSLAIDRLLKDMRKASAVPPNKRRDMMRTLGYDWHPALPDGRVNNPTVVDAGKPKLFIRNGHISANLTTPAEVIRAYEAAQSGNLEQARAFAS